MERKSLQGLEREYVAAIRHPWETHAKEKTEAPLPIRTILREPLSQKLTRKGQPSARVAILSGYLA